MRSAIRGRLISTAFAQSELSELIGVVSLPTSVRRAVDAWSERRDAALGPASSVRAITDAAAIPLLRILGFDIARRTDAGNRTRLEAVAPAVAIPVMVTPWGEPLGPAWRDAVLDGIRSDSRWSLCCNGGALRIVDTRQTWARQYLEVDLALLPGDDLAVWLLWTLLRADAFSVRPAMLDQAVERSAKHGVAVRATLGSGVLGALSTLFEALCRQRIAEPGTLLDQCLTVLYRVLFLLFAEARGLVPVWHPTYRDRYAIGTIVATLLAGRRYKGIWSAILAISRIAHAGCAIGELKVTAFNGRLFSPSHAAALDKVGIADEVMEKAVLAVGTAPVREGGRSRINYGDLDVEQLGAVYERVLEYAPAGGGEASLVRTREQRRSSGTFYTPRGVAAYLVSRTLEPLVRDLAAEDILRLRVLDPSMGSGAFLVAACRYLAAVVEDRFVQEGRWHHADVTAADRAQLRREVAQRCLYGVDVNPMAVQLARLSLWLATLASDKPLTFLDHHLMTGDSLVGARLEDVLQRPGRGSARARHRTDVGDLFGDTEMAEALEASIRTRRYLSSQPDESPRIVADKERMLAALTVAGSPQQRWQSVFDLWCAGWYWEKGSAPAPALFGELSDQLLHGRATLPSRVSSPLLTHSEALADRQRFFHWPLAFPEVFDSGSLQAARGFDAVIGNPPWDMVRGDSGDGGVRTTRRDDARRFNDFVREAGVYRAGVRAHANRYQLFIERALQLVRRGGRVGLVLPSGIATDAGAAPLRKHVFDTAAVDSISGFDNRHAIFPIHRSLRFLLMTCTTGHPTRSIACRFGLTRAEDLEGGGPASLEITRAFITRVSGPDDLSIPEIAGERDLGILEDISARIPWLSAPDGWGVAFGRELNATDDRHVFRPASGDPGTRPVLEGKQIEPFRVMLETSRVEVARGTVLPRVPARSRIAYRDVASATNRLTLIAAVVPPAAVTTHTLFCLRTRLPTDAQHVLCGLLNSFVANYLVRMRVTSHVTVSLVSRLPVPVVDRHHPAFDALLGLSRALVSGRSKVDEMPEYVELQALTFRLYGIAERDAAHILGTFPLIPGRVKEGVLRALRDGTQRHRGTEDGTQRL